jgi:DNA-binding protein HU-beta
MKPLNKKHLAKQLSNKTLLSAKESEQVIEELFNIIVENITDGHEVSIVGFGKFYSYKHNARPVRNPKTQEEMTLPEYKSIKFKVSNVIKEYLKKKTIKG